MAKAKFGVSGNGTDFGGDLIAAAREALAHKHGSVALPTRIIDPMTPARVREIRKKVAKSPKKSLNAVSACRRAPSRDGSKTRRSTSRDACF
jgi:hypothetical protein